MKIFSFIFISLMSYSTALLAANTNQDAKAQCPSFLKQTMRQLHSEQEVDLCQLTAGKTVLVVNTASHCGFTKQFKGLESLHQTYKDKGLVVIGFPSNSFKQEEKAEKDTAKVCFVNYGVTFTMLATTDVKGQNANLIFQHLAAQTTAPKWNFYKYLISSNGEKIEHFNSKVAPEADQLNKAISRALSF